MHINSLSLFFLACFVGLGCNQEKQLLHSEIGAAQPEHSTHTESDDSAPENVNSETLKIEWDARLEELVRLLKDNNVLAYGPIGRGATESLYNQAWAQTLKEDYASAIFQRVFDEGQEAAARIYALLGLWRCDSKAFDLRLPLLETGPQELITGRGCLLYGTSVKSFLTELDPITGDSSWPELFQVILDAS